MEKTEHNASACSRCNMQAGEAGAKGWRRCGKCAFLWCPRCAPDSELYSNCVGGALKPA